MKEGNGNKVSFRDNTASIIENYDGFWDRLVENINRGLGRDGRRKGSVDDSNAENDANLNYIPTIVANFEPTIPRVKQLFIPYRNLAWARLLSLTFFSMK